MSRKIPVAHTPEHLKDAFRLFEEGDQPGHVSTRALTTALTTYGSATKEQAAELVSQMDPDRTGRINYGEYVDLMTQTHGHQ